MFRLESYDILFALNFFLRLVSPVTLSTTSLTHTMSLRRTSSSGQLLRRLSGQNSDDLNQQRYGTRMSSRNTTTASFKLNLNKAMQAKLGSCSREDPLRLVQTGGGIRLYLQAGFFEIMKQAIFAATEDGSIPAKVTRREDSTKKAFSVTIKVPEYTLNLYCSGSTGLLNGRDTNLFLNVHLPLLLSSIASAFDRQSIINLNRDIVTLINGWKSSFFSEKKCTVQDIDTDICHHCQTPNTNANSFTCQICLLSTHRKCAAKKKTDTMCSPCAHRDLLPSPTTVTSTSLAVCPSPTITASNILATAASTQPASTSAICPSPDNTASFVTTLTIRDQITSITEDTTSSTELDIPAPKSTTVLQKRHVPQPLSMRSSSFPPISEIGPPVTDTTPAIHANAETIDQGTPVTDNTVITNEKTLGAPLSPQKTHPSAPPRCDDLQQKKYSKWEANCLKREKELAKRAIEMDINATYVKSLEEKIKALSTPPIPTQIPAQAQYHTEPQRLTTHEFPTVPQKSSISNCDSNHHKQSSDHLNLEIQLIHAKIELLGQQSKNCDCHKQQSPQVIILPQNPQPVIQMPQFGYSYPQTVPYQQYPSPYPVPGPPMSHGHYPPPYPVPGPPMPYSHYPWPTPTQGTCPPVPGPITSTHMPYGHMQIPPHGYFKAPPPGFPQLNQHMAYNPNLAQHGQSQPQCRDSRFNTVTSTLPHSHQASQAQHTQHVPQVPDTRGTPLALPVHRLNQQLIPAEVTKNCTTATSSTSPSHPHNQHASLLPDKRDTLSAASSQRLYQQPTPSEVSKNCTPTTSPCHHEPLHSTKSVDTFTKMGEHRTTHSDSHDITVSKKTLTLQ